MSLSVIQSVHPEDRLYVETSGDNWASVHINSDVTVGFRTPDQARRLAKKCIEAAVALEELQGERVDVLACGCPTVQVEDDGAHQPGCTAAAEVPA